MRHLKHHSHTIAACYIGYISQAIVNIFVPLLFATFQTDYSVSFSQLSLLILVNFGTQLLVDLLSVKIADAIGYRPLIVAAHIFTALGLLGLSVLPELLPPFAGLCIPVVVYAVGGGLTEVLISPIVEACPTDKKSAAMSLLHSFFCWGCVLVIAVSTAFFALFGIEKWKILSCLWAAVPLLNAVYFLFVPLYPINKEGESMKPAAPLKSRVFLLFILLMLCAGAAELAISQWSSVFAEKGLKVSKTVGDIAGPCLFALLMGVSRVVQSKLDGKVRPALYLCLSSVLLGAGYLLTALSPVAALSLAGCGICGFAVGALWPGLFSLTVQKLPKGGTAMFALLALAGDCGCGLGPFLVGNVAEASSLGVGILCAAVFPLILAVSLFFLSLKEKRG